MSDHDTLLTAEDVARLFRVKPVTVRRWAFKGILDYVLLPSGRPRHAGKRPQRYIRFTLGTIQKLLGEDTPPAQTHMQFLEEAQEYRGTLGNGRVICVPPNEWDAYLKWNGPRLILDPYFWVPYVDSLSVWYLDTTQAASTPGNQFSMVSAIDIKPSIYPAAHIRRLSGETPDQYYSVGASGYERE